MPPKWKPNPLTARQYDILEYIRDHLAARKFAPSLREMAEHFGCSYVTIHHHLQALRKKRWLTWDAYEFRSWRLTKPLPKRRQQT